MPREGETGAAELDVRGLPPHERHGEVLELFDRLAPGGSLTVVNDHEPLHLLAFLKHERRDFDPGSYAASERRPGEWAAVFAKRVSPGEAEIRKPILTSFENERRYDDASFTPVPVYGTESYRVLLTYLRAGQFIPVHTPGVDLVFVVQSGRGTVVAGGERRKIVPGDVVIVPRGVRRGILAETDMEAVHFVSPPPGDGDHEEVSRRLSAGAFE